MVSRFHLNVVGALVVSVLAFMGLSGSASAAGLPVTLTTSPVTLDLSVAPGQSLTQVLQIKNSSPVALPISMQTQVFGAYGTSGEAIISQPKPGDLSTSYVSFSPSSFTAQPNVWTSVKMSIHLPKTASLGYYYAVIFKPTLPSSTPAARSTSIKGSNAILVLVDSSAGKEVRKVSVSNFSVNKHVFEYLPVNFSVTLHNSGNIYLAPSGDIFISRNSDMSHSIASIPFNQSGANVLPNSNRVFTNNWNDGFPVFKAKTLNGQPVLNSKGQPVYSLSWDFRNANNLRIGKYYAELLFSYRDASGTKLVKSIVSFWVIPWFLLAVIGIVLILVGLGVWTLGRMLYKRFRKTGTYRR